MQRKYGNIAIFYTVVYTVCTPIQQLVHSKLARKLQSKNRAKTGRTKMGRGHAPKQCACTKMVLHQNSAAHQNSAQARTKIVRPKTRRRYEIRYNRFAIRYNRQLIRYCRRAIRYNRYNRRAIRYISKTNSIYISKQFDIIDSRFDKNHYTKKIAKETCRTSVTLLLYNGNKQKLYPHI